MTHTAQWGMLPDEARGSIRLSLGRQTTNADVARASEALWLAWQALTDVREPASHANTLQRVN